MMEDESLYEIVPMDPLDKLKSKGSELEKEIAAIKDILKETVMVSKMKTSADELVDKIIEMLKVSQDMVSAVARSNQDLSRQLQKSLDTMTESNKELSQKMDMLLDFFAEAAETPAESEAHPTVESAVADKLDKLISSLNAKFDRVAESNARVAEQTAQLTNRFQPIQRQMMPPPGAMQPRPLPLPPQLMKKPGEVI